VHLAYTFLTHRFSPTEKQLETAMKQVAPRISGENHDVEGLDRHPR
jgi:hypothetical protein